MKHLIAALLVTCVLSLGSCNKNKVTKIPLPEGFIENDWDQALSVANDNDRKVFVHFYADWCSLCASFKEEVLNEAEVEAYMLSNFVGASLDSEKDPGKPVFENYGLSGHPNLIVTDKEGNLLGQHRGKLSKADFLDWIRQFE